jgi:hypothetical protein
MLRTAVGVVGFPSYMQPEWVIRARVPAALICFKLRYPAINARPYSPHIPPPAGCVSQTVELSHGDIYDCGRRLQRCQCRSG